MNTNFEARFMVALKRNNIVEKCHELSQLIQEGLSENYKEVQTCYPTLVENLFAFGFQSDSNINLRVISSQTHQIEFHSILSLMHPEGPLFQWIRHLMKGNAIAFDFPVSCLPLPSRCLIEERLPPEFYLNRLSSDGASMAPTRVSLNAFEFFLFHFAYYIHNCAKVIPTLDVNANPANILYITLVEMYLNYFVPLDSSNVKNTVSSSSPETSLWQSLSSTFHLNTNQNTPLSLPKTSLLNLNKLLNRSNEMQYSNQVNNSKAMDPLGSTVTKAETVLNILVEVWVNVKVPMHILKKMPSHTQLQQPLLVNNQDHMRCVRILVKHLHYFVNSLLSKKLPINVSIFENHELDELKRNIWTNKYVFLRRFYSFIRVAFDKWPLDASFRLPLEVWLSFIQPWRYLDPSTARTNEDGIDQEGGRPDNQPIDLSWQRFIDDNLLFFTVLFRQLIPRFMRLDLSSSINSFMLFRVIKVYNQTNLVPMIKETEKNFEGNFSPTKNMNSRLSLISSPYRSPGHSSITHGLIYRHPLLECEPNDFTYVKLFSEQTRQDIEKLLKKIHLTRNELAEFIRSHQTNSNEEAFSFKSLMKSFNPGEDQRFDLDEKHHLSDKIKTENYLGILYERIATIFNINPAEVEANIGDSDADLIVNGSPIKKPSVSFASPISPINGSNSSLHQRRVPSLPIEGPLTKEIRYQGNPDLQPIRSYEIAFLARLFIALSQIINEKYSPLFSELYNRDDAVGWLSKLFLAPPTSYYCLEKLGGLFPPQRKIVDLPPRIVLRKLAHRNIYIGLTIFYVLTYIFGFSKWTLFWFTALLYFTFILIKSITNWINNA